MLKASAKKQADKQQDERTENPAEPARGLNAWFVKHPFFASLASGILFWFAFPPTGAWPLIFLAPLPLLAIIQSDPLPRKYLRRVWLGTLIYWAATLYFIPIPHPALWGGWVLMSLYLSLYIPAFVLISRIAVQRWNLPLYLIAPVVWTGLEYFRVHFLTGFGFALLGHAPFKVPLLIQVADLFGAYTLSFIFMAISTLVWFAASKRISSSKNISVSRRIGCLAFAVLMFACLVVYGFFRIGEATLVIHKTNPTIGIIQGNIDTVFPSNEEEAIQIEREKIDQYRQLASSSRLRGTEGSAKCDLLVWPEGKFMWPHFFSYEDQATLELAAELEDQSRLLAGFFLTMQSVKDYQFRDDPPGTSSNAFAIPSIVGAGSTEKNSGDKFNSALLIDEKGMVQKSYFKMHRVMVGEYMPFENIFPAIAKLSPSDQGLTAGKDAVALELDDFVFCPNICFESCVPHVIRRQVNQLSTEGKEPDYLVNLSDDGWFFGTSCLDFHLANTVFRAVETRKPTIAAANTGISAFIDGNGRLIKKGPRRETAILIHDLERDGRYSLYRFFGDWPVFLFFVFSVCILASGLISAKSN